MNEINIIYNKLNINKNLDNSDGENSNNNLIREKNLIFLSYFEDIKKVIHSLILLIDVFKVNKTNFYTQLINKNNEIENNSQVCLRNIEDYNYFLKNLKGFNINIIFYDINEYNSVFVEFLNILPNNEEGIKFGIGKNNNEIRSLSEFIGESENSKIQINDIQDFMNVCNFFENMRALNVKDDIELIQEFKTACIMTPSFANSFTNYLNNFKEIKNIYEEYLDRPEVSRNKIEQILKSSNIEIDFDNESRSFKVNGAYKDILNQNKSFDYNDLQELHDRALLFSNKTFDTMASDVVENYENKKKNSENFVDLVDNINQLINYFKSLYIKGYPNQLKIIIQIENSIALSEEKNLQFILDYYKNLSNDLEIAQTKAYKEKKLIRLIYGYQFYDIYNYLFNMNFNGNIMPLLKKLSNNKIKKITKNNSNKYNKNIFDFDNNSKKFSHMIEIINDFLFNCLKYNEIKLNNLYEENIIRKEFSNKLKPGIYSWVDDIKLDIKIIQAYKIITNNFPLPITTLLCTKETNEEEITSFIYRFVLCEFNVLFIIMNSDNLELSNAQYLLWIIENLYIQNENMIKSILLITFTDNNSELRKELKKIRGHDYFIPENYIYNIKNDFNENLIEIWSSDATGVGKSTQIKLKAKKNNRNYIYFPLGGVISRKDLINRIIKLEINKQNSNNNYLHLDIYESNDETSLIIKEFLFSLLILKNYSFEEKIFYLDSNIKIVIEKPTGFYDIKDKYILLNYFYSKKINIENLPDLIDLENNNNDNYNNRNNNLTDIQLVTQILLMLEKGTIEDTVFNLEKKHKTIPINICQNIINKYFTLPKGNYYQKIAFIHILADQFRKFCFSEYLNPEVLLQNEKVKNQARFGFLGAFTKTKKKNNNELISYQKNLNNNMNKKININNNRINNMKNMNNENNLDLNNNLNIQTKINNNIYYRGTNLSKNINQKLVNNNIQNNTLNINRQKAIFLQNNINNEINIQNIDNNNDEVDNYNKNNFRITYVRKIMIENLIKLTLYFIKGPFTKIILNQKNIISQMLGEFNEKKINEIANKYLSNTEEERISFEKINPSLVFFNEDIQTFSIITTSKKGDEEYEQLLRLYNSQNISNKDIPLINYRNLTHEQFLIEVKNVLNLNELSYEDIKNLIGLYCFTSDNFIKMILILLRIRAGIPVIMMGETGCGKTSLIKILSTLLNKGKMNLKIMNIHAGIEDKDIIDFIKKIDDEENYEYNDSINNRINTSNDKIWVFFDEINTCNCMGLLSEIFYNHSYYGKKLNNRLTFIAACNPYRLKPIKKIDNEENDFCLTSKDKQYSYNSKQNLVYLVNPLPHSLLTSIFDFGHLSLEDEKKYIKNIVKETLKKYAPLEEVEILFVEEIFECQNFVRENNDISTVSLRELRRFNILFEFFVKYLEERKEIYENKESLLKQCLCLSLYFCYYIRLSNNKLRNELIEKINQKFKKENYFEEVVVKEKEFLVSKMKIPPGIAKNSTLTENIFSLFVCILNKIPLIMCGKPGTGKSLSFQIVYDSMKGERSENEFFKKYPEILIFSYQGSKTSTSEGVQKVFNRAKTCLKKHQEKMKKNSENLEIKNSSIQIARIPSIISINNKKKTQKSMLFNEEEKYNINKMNDNNDIIENQNKDILAKTQILPFSKEENNNNIQINNTNENKNQENDILVKSQKIPLITKKNSFNNLLINNNNIKNNQKKNKILKEEIKENIIPVVYFDEMGLAEESPHNPLKVIHFELEYDDMEQKIAFIGISNWKLDASKMNRTIFLGVPHLEEKDLQETATEIAQNLEEQIYIKYKELFSNLVKTYWNYKNFTKTKNQSEFHGLRDFYHLIKNAMFYLTEINNSYDQKEINVIEKSYEIGIKSLYRNFDGLREPFNSYEEIKKIFDNFYPNSNISQHPNVFKCLQDNINDGNSRYLLIIMKSSMSIHLLKNIMYKLSKKYIFYNGSQLSEDLNQEKYNEKLLNKIQLSLENGDILVLRNMENIYPSLYNLFNQNFTTLGKKKFSRIAFANYNTYSVVHEDFRAIVLVDEKKIKEKMEDPPFLNRFEKHVFSFEYLMSEGELKISKNIIEYLDAILSFNNNNNCKIDLKKQVLWYNPEEIKGLVVKECNNYNQEKSDIINFENNIINNIFQIISKLLSQDIMAYIIINENELKMKNDIKNYYEKNHLHNFYELFERSKNIFIKGKSAKLIIYTFSKLLETIIKEDSPIMTQFGNLNKKNIIEIIVKSIKYDSDFDNIISNFYAKEENKILIFKFNENDLDKINQIKFKITNIENENKNKIIFRENKFSEKHIIFIIYLNRHKIDKNIIREKTIDDLISNIDEEYNQYFIDNLNGKFSSNILENITKSPSDYIEQIFNLKKNYLVEIIQNVFQYLTYEFKTSYLEGQNYIGEIITKLLKNDFLLDILKNKFIKESGKNIIDFIKTIFSKGICEKNDIEFIDIIFNSIYDKIYILFFKFIFKAEKDHLLYPLLQNYDFIKNQTTLTNYIKKYIDNLDFGLINVIERINSNQIILFMNLVLPLSKKWYDLINIFIENNIKENYLNNENNIRFQYFEDEETMKEIEVYESKEKDIINYTKAELLRIDGLNDLIKSNNITFFKLIYQDFLTIYLNKRFNDNSELGLEFLDILIQLKLNINKNDNYSFINNANEISLEDSFCNFNENNFNNIENQEIKNIRYDLDTLSKILVFLISYCEEIYSIMEIFFTLNKYLRNFYNDWKKSIMKKEIKYEINENVPEYTREINEAFFIMYESLIKGIFTYKNYTKMEENDFYEYLESIKKILNDAKQIYLKLFLPSKEMYTLQILINIFITYDSCKEKKPINNIRKLFSKIIENITSENNYIISKDYKNIENNFNGLLSILEEIFSQNNNEKEYSFLLNNLFLSRYNKVLDDKYRKILVETYFNKITDKQLKFIFPILKKLINDIEPMDPENPNSNEQEKLDTFMSHFYFNNEDLNFYIYNTIVKKNNNILYLNILYYFECECELYFRKISKGKEINKIENQELEPYSDDIIKNLSIKYFRKAIEYYLDEKPLNHLETQIKIIGKLYSLAYIKIYLKKVSEFIVYNMNKNILNFMDIYEILLCKNNNPKIYSLKIFLFKCIFKNINKNYLAFIESIKTDQNLNPLLNHDEFGKNFDKIQNKHCYNFSFININNYEIFNKLSQIIDISLENIEDHPEFNNILNYIYNNNNYNNNNFELIYNILINKFIFDLHGNANYNLNEKANLFMQLSEKMKINIHKNSKNLINFLINRDSFNKKILSKLKLPKNVNLDEDILYILFFSIKLVTSSQNIPKNIFSYFYSKRKDLIASLSNLYFPGAFPINNELIDSYFEIEEHLRNQPSNFAIYMCSCGRYYTINPCGFPTMTAKCGKCGLKIGGTRHQLFRRKGHFRIVLDEKAKFEIFDNSSDKDMPYMLLKDFKKEKIDPLLNKNYKGIGKIGKEIINKTGNDIRNINELSFRIMNFILYSHLLISNILEILNDKDISNYFSEETSCFDILISNWNKMQDLLNKIGINNIKSFMNIIFEKIIQIISKYQITYIEKVEGRNTIENEFNSILNDLNNIKKEISKYEQINQQILNSSPLNMSSLIQQLYSIPFYLSNEPYLYFKYLYLYSYPKSSEIINIIDSNTNYKSKYPLTLKILKYFESHYNNEISLLKYIPKINKKLNHLIDNYSYKIGRNEAAKKTIKEEFNKNENNLFVINNLKQDTDIKIYMKDIFNLFEDFKDIPLQWGCHPLSQMTINSDSVLCSVLLDDNEPGYYLASIYKKLIEYQNVFLDNIINCNSLNGLLHCFVKQLNSEIMVQDATINEIVKLNIDENEKNNLRQYTDLDEIIIINISNNPLNNKFNYELDQIEIELGNLILTGVRKFKSTDDELRYITYMFEGYRGKNSNILTNFNEKYSPKDLTQKEKNILYYFIHNFAKDEYKNFLFSIQILIKYIQKSGKSKITPIYQIISNLPPHITIDINIKNLFSSNKKITINKLVRIFEFFELLCWNQITDNLLDEFMRPLGREKIDLIEKYFREKNSDKNIIKKIELAGAVRKFISRYLAGKRSQSEVGDDKMLFEYLNRVDLWERNIDDPNFEKEFFELSTFKITVGEGKDFYDKLGGDGQILNSFIKVEENIENDKKEKNIIDNENVDKNEIILNSKNNGKDEEEINETKNKNNHDELIEGNNRKKLKKRKLF